MGKRSDSCQLCMMRIQLINYVIGTILFFLLMAFMPMNQRDTDTVIIALFLTVGTRWGLVFKNNKSALVIVTPFLALLAFSFL